MKRSFYAARDLYKYRHSYPVHSCTHACSQKSWMIYFPFFFLHTYARRHPVFMCSLQNFRKSRQPNEYRNLRFYMNKIPLVPDGKKLWTYWVLFGLKVSRLTLGYSRSVSDEETRATATHPRPLFRYLHRGDTFKVERRLRQTGAQSHLHSVVSGDLLNQKCAFLIMMRNMKLK